MNSVELENAKRNINRVNLKLSNLTQNITEIKEKFKKCKIFKIERLGNTINNKLVKIEDIDFKKSNIFISDKLDILPLFTYIGLIQLNNIIYPDITSSGRNSVITKTYMIVNSRDIRYSKIPLDAFYNDARDGVLPESWNSINFFKKDIIAWRLTDDVGIGDNIKMYDGCASWIEDRYNSGKLDWMFYRGTYDSFKDTYSLISNLELPIYKITFNDSSEVKQINYKKEEKEEKDVKLDDLEFNFREEAKKKHNIYRGGLF